MNYAAITKEVSYDRLERAYRVTVEGNFLGYTATSIEGWELADAYAYNLLLDTAPVVESEVLA